MVRAGFSATVVCVCLGAAPAAAITGNAPAAVQQGRSAVMITGSTGTVCTGAAISRDLVLTAAHCTLPGPNYRVAGLAVRMIARHPNFKLETMLNHRATADVALIKLETPLPDDILPAALSVSSRTPAPGDRFSIAGYGTVASGVSRGLGTLRSAQLIATGKPGVLQLRLVDPASGGGMRAGMSACTGDSGAPAFEGTALIGVVSWSTGPNLGDGCGGMTGVTPLTLYRSWIIETARKLGSPLDP
jgi:hypothetical protein